MYDQKLPCIEGGRFERLIVLIDAFSLFLSINLCWPFNASLSEILVAPLPFFLESKRQSRPTF